jgi:uncharacterized protein
VLNGVFRVDRFWSAGQGGWLLVIELGLAALIGMAFLLLGLSGGAWILGGIGAGAIAFWIHKRSYPQTQANRNARKVGQMLVGLAVGFSLQHNDLLGLSTSMPLFLLLTILLLAGGGAIGYFYAQVEKTDLLTALLATTPGNLGVMGSIAADYQRNAALVSLVQLLRFTVITVLVPLVAHVSHSPNLQETLQLLIPSKAELTLGYGLWLISILLCTRSAVQLGHRLKVPVAALLCAIAVGAAFNPILHILPLFPAIDFHLPPLLNLLGQLLLGITIGEFWAITPPLNWGTSARAIVPVILTLVAGLATAAIAKLLSPWDWITCLLIAAPGGSPEMIWLALTLDQNVEVVTAAHLLRLIAINLSLPLLVTFTAQVEQKNTHSSSEKVESNL